MHHPNDAREKLSTLLSESKMMLCPRCEQGDVIRGIIRSTNEMIYVCQECEASWSKAEDVGTETFFDFGTYMVGLGLNPLWTELELDFAEKTSNNHSSYR